MCALEWHCSSRCAINKQNENKGLGDTEHEESRGPWRGGMTGDWARLGSKGRASGQGGADGDEDHHGWAKTESTERLKTALRGHYRKLGGLPFIDGLHDHVNADRELRNDLRGRVRTDISFNDDLRGRVRANRGFKGGLLGHNRAGTGFRSSWRHLERISSGWRCLGRSWRSVCNPNTQDGSCHDRNRSRWWKDFRDHQTRDDRTRDHWTWKYWDHPLWTTGLECAETTGLGPPDLDALRPSDLEVLKAPDLEALEGSKAQSPPPLTRQKSV